MPSTCQLASSPDNTWNATHVSMNGQRNDGFAKSSSGPVAMGYWTPEDLPFYAGLARTFVLADRWFASIPAQTFPNRYCLLSGTANGLITNTLPPHEPANGSIMELLDAHGISWLNYYSTTPSTDLFPNVISADKAKQVPIAQFSTDAAAGSLPFFSLVEPDYSKSSEEDPQDIRVGEQFASKVINAAMHGPGWSKTLLVWCYDESGGYYDHVPPPAAPVPDAVPPNLESVRRARRVRPVRVPRPGGRRLTSREARPRVVDRLRPHVDPAACRDEVEPPGADEPRRPRREPPRLRRPPRHAGLPHAAPAAPAVPGDEHRALRADQRELHPVVSDGGPASARRASM